MPNDTQLRQLIASGDLEKALEVLLAYTEGTTRHTSAVQLAARFNILKNNEMKGIVSFSEANMERNKITDSILALLEGKTSEVSKTSDVSQSRQWNWKKISGWAVVAIGVLAGVAEFSGYSLRDLFGGGTVGETTSVTVFVHGKGGCEDLILRQQGYVLLRIGKEKKKETIGEKGEANFHNLHVGDRVHLQIDFSEPYRAVRPDSTYTVTADGSICLEARLENLHHIFGRVIADDQPLPGVIVFINTALRDTTDELGNYEIQIPPDRQQQEQEVSFFKSGFKLLTKRAFPQTNEPLNVVMEK